MNLEELGWSEHFQRQLSGTDPSLLPARITCEEANSYLIASEQGEFYAELAGRFRLDATDPGMMPKTGDWVLVQLQDGTRKAVIHRLLERKTVFLRKEAGENTSGQVLAANFDTVFLVNGLDQDFNPRRIERYLALVRETGAQIVIVLNKSDLCPDPEEAVRSLAGIAFDVPVIVVSALNGTNLRALDSYLQPGRTAALIGSSGCGKSMLVNALIAYERQEIGDLKESDQRGRHTTTRRELVNIPGRGWIMDNPGLREIQLWSDTAGLASAFPEIDVLAGNCRFRDCTHMSEPGCAVRTAVESGTLDSGRFRNYLQMKKELAFLGQRQQEKTRRTEKKIGKKNRHDSRRNDRED